MNQDNKPTEKEAIAILNELSLFVIKATIDADYDQCISFEYLKGIERLKLII